MRRKKLDLAPGTDVHRLVVTLIKLKVESEILMKATGRSRQEIAAIRAHITMGTY